MSARSRLLQVLSVGAVSAAVALASASSPAAAAAPTITTNAADAAAGWLAQQLVDGTHLVYSFDGTTFDGGGTADLIFALAAAKSGKDTIDDAITYFQAHVADYTSITDTSGQPGPYDGSIGKTAVAAFAAGADPTSFGGYNLLQTLKSDECTAVSAPTSDTDYTTPVCPAIGAGRNIYSSISESLIITAEARGGATYTPSAPAIAYLLSLQCTDGGFTSQTTGGSGCTSDIDATGYAIMALQALGANATALGNAADYLESVRNSDGSFTSQGFKNVDSTGLATAGLEAAGRSTTTSHDWLASQQVTSGPTIGKNASRGALKYNGAFDPASSVKGTSDGMLGLTGASLATLTDAGAAAKTTVLALDDPTLASSKIKAGSDQTVTGTGFSVGEKVGGVLHSKKVNIGTATANAKGTATLTFTVPASLAVGSHTVVLTGRTSGLTSQVTFTVEAAPSVPNEPSQTVSSPVAGPTTASGGANLADTGRNGQQTQHELLLGFVLVALGAGALLLGRRGKRAR